MSGIKPIPKRLLPHTISYKEYDGTGTFGENFKPTIDIKHVRLEPSNKKISTNVSGQPIQDIVATALMFVDFANSSHTTIKEKSEVVFKGRKMKVQIVEPVYAFDGEEPHHLEVYLS